jgi:hypothetical protein
VFLAAPTHRDDERSSLPAFVADSPFSAIPAWVGCRSRSMVAPKNVISCSRTSGLNRTS